MSEIDFLALVDSCLCTSIRKLSRNITRIYDKYLEPSGLNINQLGLLLTIKGQNELNEDSTIGSIGDRLVMEKSTLSRNIRKLENQGFLIMEIHPDNRSQKRVSITDKGLQVILDAYAYWDEVQNRIRSKFGPDNFSQLISLLNILQSDLSEEFEQDFI